MGSSSSSDSESYRYIMYTPNLGSEIAVLGREREQGRFRGSTEGAGRSNGEHWGSTGAQQASKGGRSKRGEVLAPRRA